jgi:type I restriction enzyme S subunit
VTGGWKTKPLGSVCDFEGGSQPPKSQFIHEYKPGYVRFLQIRDFKSDNHVTFIPESSKNSICRSDEILIGRYGASVGKILTGKAGAYNVAMVKAIPDISLIDMGWFYNYLISEEFQDRLLNIAARSAQAGFNKEDIRDFPVPVPPRPEQQRIVGILDKAFAAIATAKANTEENLLNARAIFTDQLELIFNGRNKAWEERRLGDVAATQYGLSEPMNEEGHGFKIFRMGEVQDGQLIDTGQMKFADIPRSEFDKYKLRSGDVLFNRTNSFELVGKTGIFQQLSGDYCFASYLVRVLPDRKILLPEFLNYFMNTRLFQASVKTKASKSINQANINATILSNEMVRFPDSVSEQRLMVSGLNQLREETRRLERVQREKASALDELKKSMLHQAFHGQF